MDNQQFETLFKIASETNKVVSSMQGDFREFKGNIAARVEGLEDGSKSDRFWGRVSTIMVMPVMAVVHQIGTKYGWFSK